MDNRFCQTPQAASKTIELDEARQKSHDAFLHEKTYYDIQRRSMEASVEHVQNNVGNHSSVKAV